MPSNCIGKLEMTESEVLKSSDDFIMAYDANCGNYALRVTGLLADVNAQLAAQQQEIDDLKQLISELS